jgi:DNA end-binding protein Ku
LYPATSDSDKISFNQINRNTGHRIKYAKVDADTGEEVAAEDIMKGYKVDTDTYIEVSKDELENIALESTRTIDIDEFVPKSSIDPRYLIRPYYLVPDGKVGHDAFAVIRETIRSMDKVAIGRVVLTSREHIIGLEPLEKGLMGTLLRYPYEVRDEKEYFDDIRDVKVTKDMLDLAKHIVNQKTADFDPEKFEDHYEEALTELINAKRSGRTISAKPRPTGENVVDLMDALKKSIASEATPRETSPARPRRARRKCSCRSRGRSRRRKLPSPSGQQSARPDNRRMALHDSRKPAGESGICGRQVAGPPHGTPVPGCLLRVPVRDRTDKVAPGPYPYSDEASGPA